ncbi:CapA family protein [Paenibacillus montanisoli]|uniref:CapA family protein n=1 Tax=Paenibacillus montanisoli TaxID=2081970 RepID=A0A328TYR0_9BACL|nr:CapA family protein [Paenibacillus montanisoli]RAP75520.1 CapA family protein [Paenibacillus montanisoli]
MQSRSESRQLQKQQRARRMKRLFAINLILLLIIGALAVVYAVQRQDGSGKPNTAADQGTAANDAASETEQANTDEKESASADHSSGNQAAEESGTDSSAGNQGSNEQAEEGHPSDDPASGGKAEEEPPAKDGEQGQDSSEGGTAAGTASKVRLAFTGDVLLAASVEKLMLSNGYDYPYEKVLNYLKAPDFMAVNLETPVTLRGTPAKNKQYVYKSSPDALPALKEAGIDIVNLANNHTLDQGEEGLFDTIAHLDEAGIPNMGAGRDEIEAFKPVLLEKGGISVAYVGLTRVVPVASWKAGKTHPGLAETYDSTRAVAAIKQAAKQADIVVVMVHWGIEREDWPNNDQKRLAHEYIDAGADLVIGSHPHVLQGFESYKGKWIAYSLGNFIFSGMKPDKTKDTGVLDAACDVKGDCSLKFHPMRASMSQPAPLAGEEGKALLKRLSSISMHAAVDKAGNVQPKE